MNNVLGKHSAHPVSQTLQSIVSQLEGLNSRKDEGISVYIAEVTTQLTEMNLKLAEIGSDVRAAATASDIAEEISTVKDAHAHEYKASLSASERIQASIVSLENYTKSAVDQINAVGTFPSHTSPTNYLLYIYIPIGIG